MFKAFKACAKASSNLEMTDREAQISTAQMSMVRCVILSMVHSHKWREHPPMPMSMSMSQNVSKQEISNPHPGDENESEKIIEVVLCINASLAVTKTNWAGDAPVPEQADPQVMSFGRVSRLETSLELSSAEWFFKRIAAMTSRSSRVLSLSIFFTFVS